MQIALKIDVDTLEGYSGGVPALAAMLGRLGIRATFCVAMGPDCSGRAIRRVFTKRGFLGKMLRTRATVTYSRRTMLYGTLLPAPQIVASRPGIIADLLAAGHEVIPHGWDHVAWHDFLPRWSPERTERELRRACETFERHSGRPCEAFAAPGWQATDRSLRAQAVMGLSYSADTRGWAPFFPLVDGAPLGVLQIPTTLPTLDELIGRPQLKGACLLDVMRDLLARPPAETWQGTLEPAGEQSPLTARDWTHVLTAHAEVEGGRWLEWFERLLRALEADGARFLTLRQVADQTLTNATGPPSAAVAPGFLPGRAGSVSCQVVQ